MVSIIPSQGKSEGVKNINDHKPKSRGDSISTRITERWMREIDPTNQHQRDGKRGEKCTFPDRFQTVGNGETPRLRHAEVEDQFAPSFLKSQQDGFWH